MDDTLYDLAVVGGGINGAGIAADAAGRGLKVILFEKSDLASGTSSASSKLIHGGLRYLEHYEFRLVRESLAEREVLLARAPHLIWPLRFILPHVPGMRPRLLLQAGLFLYDRLAARHVIPSSGAVDLARDPAGRALKAELGFGFSYYDCWVDDARLVIAAALDARARGATILTRTAVTGVREEGDGWRLTATQNGASSTFAARAAVNAAGPWCAALAGLVEPATTPPRIKLVRGTHIVVPRIAGADDAYLMQNPDGRVVFALPFAQRFTMIGTTDVPVEKPEDGFVPSREEEAYLLETAGRFFSRAPSASDVVWRFAGVRPLMDDGAARASAVTRDYKLDLVAAPNGAPLLSVIGGKITTFRRLAEAALERLAPFFPGIAPAWTARSPLPGGDFCQGGIAAYRLDVSRRYAGISSATLQRLVTLYGTNAARILDGASSEADLGAALGGGLTEREVVYLRDHEWARAPEDVLWRRTKAGLDLSLEQREATERQIARLLSA